MFDQLRKIFGAETSSTISSGSQIRITMLKRKKLQVATCAIFLEMAKSDDNCTDEERQVKLFPSCKEHLT